MRQMTKAWLGIFAILCVLLSACSETGESPGTGDADGQPDGDADGQVDGDLDEESPDADGDSEEADDTFFESRWWPIDDPTGVLDLLDDSPFFAARSWLVKDMSAWFESGQADPPGSVPDDASRLGYYAVGNGVAFGFVGSYHPRNTLHEMIGPDFQKSGKGFFSDVSALIEIEGSPLAWTNEWIWRVRRTQIPLTRMQVEGSSLELDTITFAPRRDSMGDERRTLVQVLNLRNTGSDVIDGASLRLQNAAPVELSGEGYWEQMRGTHRCRLAPLEEGWSVEEAESVEPYLRSPVVSLEAGEERQFVAVYEFGYEDETLGDGRSAVRAAGWEQLLDDTAAWWRAWHAAGLQVLTEDTKVNDLIDGLKGAVKVQMAENGALCPMSHYTGVWIRDSFGPTRMFLKFGYHADAWAVSDYYRAASAMAGGIGNARDADIVPADPLPQVDWLGNIPFSGRLRGEGPSYIPLMHSWLWRYTGMDDRLTARWSYLMHTLKGQGITDDGLLYFSGDETFRPQLAANWGYSAEYAFEELTYSANSGFLFVAACEQLGAFAEASDASEADVLWLSEHAATVRAATDRAYWLEDDGRYSPVIYMENGAAETRPAEDVNTKPLWLGYLDRSDPQARENIESVIAAIGQDNGLIQNQLGEESTLLGYDIGQGIMTGMGPAYFLYNVAELNLEQAETVFDTVGTYVSPSGNLPEVALFAEPGRALAPVYDRAGSLGELWARHRQWEGAIAAEAFEHYLIGYEADVAAGWLRVAPRLPHGSKRIEARNLRFGEHGLTMTYEWEWPVFGLRIEGPDDPQSAGLNELRVRLVLPIRDILSVETHTGALTEDDYNLTALGEGGSEIELVLTPAAEMFVAVGGERSDRERK